MHSFKLSGGCLDVSMNYLNDSNVYIKYILYALYTEAHVRFSPFARRYIHNYMYIRSTVNTIIKPNQDVNKIHST